MQALFARAALARRAGRHEEAEATYRAWLALEPANPAPAYGLSHLLLARGAYAEGWSLYEARADIPETGVKKPPLSFPEWRGEAVKSLLIWPEQGFGDQIMFARWIPELAARGMDVTLLTPPPLVRLFGGLGVAIMPAEGAVAIPRHDAWCLIGSLPRLIGTLPSAPYLQGAAGGRGVGVMPVGNPRQVNDVNRSLPTELAENLRRLGRDLAPEATGAKDFQDTAEIIRDLEAVVTVDTSVAHLAGAMGKPVRILLAHDACWRWGRANRSAFYPSADLIRQPRPGDWGAALQQLRTCAG